MVKNIFSDKSLSTGYVLGLSYNYHDAGAALLYNGEIVGAVEEERFTRIKGDSSFPINSVSYLLESNGLNVDDLEAVVYYESPYLKFNRLLSTLLLGRIRSLPLFLKAMNTWIDSKLWVERDIKRNISKKVKIVLLHHHISHGASAFYPSPFEKSIVLTMDGVGEWSSTTLGVGDGYRYEIFDEITFPNSLGLLYSAFTHFTGFKINSGEYKMMGLAPFGEPRFVDLIKKELISLNSDGSYSLNPKYFSFDREERTYNQFFIELIGYEPRNPKEPIRKIDEDLAASIQVVLNEALLSLCSHAASKYGIDKLVMAGGVALNVVSVGAIERSAIFKEIWVQPCSGDGGGALGSALYYHFNRVKERDARVEDSMSGSFLGPLHGDDREIKTFLEEGDIVFENFSDSELADEVSRELASGMIVGICKGRMEYGPRALGARSILADARVLDMQGRLNLKTKFREGFRPFAPMILESEMDRLFENATTSPYMLKTFFFKDEFRFSVEREEDLIARVQQVRSPWPAITHIDYSARVQSIDEGRNPFIHALLSNFFKLTGSPLIVNTSFNVRGEPIVLGYKEAFAGFKSMDIDVLVIGNYLIKKSRNPKLQNLERRVFKED